MVIVEKSFPRGGIPVADNATEPKEKVVFGAVQKKTTKSNRNKNAVNITDDYLESENQKLETISAELLNYDTIQDGMIIMGVVKNIDQLYLNISLPGRIIARVSALDISDAYTKSMKEFLQNSSLSDGYKPLSELYRVGDIVYGRIKEVKQNDKGYVVVHMTLKPNDVHADLNHSSIRKGFIFNGAVEEVQEHGYIIESGIKSLRCFVPLEKSEAGHVVGELIHLKVDKITLDQSASTCICKEVQANRQKVKDQSDPNLDYLLPSTIVRFQVNKLLKDGLQGTIMNESFTAYVNEHQLSDPLHLPDDYESNATYEARILYVMPLTKLVYLTLNLRTNNALKIDSNDEVDSTQIDGKLESDLKQGDIIEKAKVHHMGTGGVILILNNKYKGLLSYKSIKTNYKGNYDQDELLSKYAKRSKHKVRIIEYDIMDSIYICTDDASKVNEKYFALHDLNPGDFVTAVVKNQNPKFSGYNVAVGKLNGMIEKLFLAPSSKVLEEKSKIKCRVVAVNMDRKTVYLTNRIEYMSQTCSILTSLTQAKINGNYLGTIVKCDKNLVLVKFFGDVKGVFYNNTFSAEFEEGQTMKFRIVSKKNDQIILGLVDSVFKLGEICPITVLHKLDSGLEISAAYNAVEDGEAYEVKGLIPIRMLSDFVDLLKAKLNMFTTDQQIEAAHLSGSIFSIRDVKYFSKRSKNDWSSIQPGDILKASIQNIQDDIVEVTVPISGYSKPVKIHSKMLLMQAYNMQDITISSDQAVYVQVLGKTEVTKTITLSALLTDVWDGQMSTTAEYFQGYLDEVAGIRKALKKQGNPIARYSIGNKVNAVFQCVNDKSNYWEYTLEGSEVIGIVKSSIVGTTKTPDVGTKQECIVLWIDYSNSLVFLSNKQGDMNHITNTKEIPSNLVRATGINAKVLFKDENVFVCSLKKGKNPLVCCPTRLHYNDFTNSASINVNESDLCKLAFINDNKPMAILDATYKIWQDFCKRRIVAESLEAKTEAKKRKLSETEDIKDTKVAKKVAVQKVELNTKVKQKKVQNVKEKAQKRKVEEEAKNNTKDKDEEQSSALLFFEDKTPDKKAASRIVPVRMDSNNSDEPPKKKQSEAKTLPGVGDFWATDLNKLSNNIESSEEDDNDDESSEADSKQKNSKKKLTAAEKFKQQREEESRLRAIEEKYADPNQLPETVDQFDRLVLSDPNNSKHWINYMVYHLQSTEIDKARAVARRALKTITFRNSEEQINVWLAMLNLELRYGSKESFDDSLKEALMYNEPLKIYLRTVEILSDAQKNTELVEMIGNITKKFKTEVEVWRVSANALFTIGMAERAQQLLHKALACLPERDHVNTIVMFANLNHKHGNNEMAQTLLDQIVTSYPKRVDVWCQYVDLLIKEDLIDSARNVLERAIIQKIPLKKMRTIFKKYLEFEERFGNDVNVQRVKQLAVEFVQKNEHL